MRRVRNDKENHLKGVKIKKNHGKREQQSLSGEAGGAGAAGDGVFKETTKGQAALSGSPRSLV